MIEIANTFFDKVDVGTKLLFSNEKQHFTVRASNRFYAVCTKPLNLIKRIGGKKYEHTKTVSYTVIDFTKNIRGTENLIFSMGSETNEQCEEMLERLTNAKSDISYRNNVPLNIISFKLPKK